MPRLSTGKFRTNLTLSAPTHEWLREHSLGERGMGALIDQIVTKERFSKTLEDRIAALEAVMIRGKRTN